MLEGRTGEPASAAGVRLWAGRAADSFYVDLSLLALVNAAVAQGTAPDLSGWNPDKAQNSFAGTAVESIVLEIPHEHPLLRPASGSASGARPSWPPTPAAGGRSTGPGTR